MSILKLTKRHLDSLKPTDSRRLYVWDTSLKGFGACVFPSGRKVFVLQYRTIGRRSTRRITLGAYGALTVDQARAIAQDHLAAIARGSDPGAARRGARDAQTVAELGDAYLDDARARNKPKTFAESQRLWRKHVLPRLGTRAVAEVSGADVARLHREMRTTPYCANRVLATVSAFFSFAAREGVRPKHDNPAQFVRPYAEQSRERFLTAGEFARLGQSLAKAERDGLRPAPSDRKKPKSEATTKHRSKQWDVAKPANQFAIAAIRLLALTGCRRGEILALKWGDVDLEHGYLRLTDTKTGRSVRPLGAAAASVLASLPHGEDSDYVLPGTRPNRHLSSLTHTWNAVRHSAAIMNVRLHDLRHSFAAVPAAEGQSLLIIRALLGHSNVQTTQRYAHLGDDPVKAAADHTAETIAAWMQQAHTPVTPMVRKSARGGPRRSEIVGKSKVTAT